MAWPPAYSSAFIGTGATTIKWGTDGIWTYAVIVPGNPPVFKSFNVESIRAADDIENFYIENGSGERGTRIQLFQGRNWVITAVDDTNMAPPSPNMLISVTDPLSGQVLNFRVVQSGYNAGRKVEGKREITAELLTLVDNGGAVPPA